MPQFQPPLGALLDTPLKRFHPTPESFANTFWAIWSHRLHTVVSNNWKMRKQIGATWRATTSALTGNGSPKARPSSWAATQVAGCIHKFHKIGPGIPVGRWLKTLHASEQKLTQPFESMTTLIQWRKQMFRQNARHIVCATAIECQALKARCLNPKRLFFFPDRYLLNARRWRFIRQKLWILAAANGNRDLRLKSSKNESIAASSTMSPRSTSACAWVHSKKQNS